MPERQVQTVKRHFKRKFKQLPSLFEQRRAAQPELSLAGPRGRWAHCRTSTGQKTFPSPRTTYNMFPFLCAAAFAALWRVSEAQAPAPFPGPITMYSDAACSTAVLYPLYVFRTKTKLPEPPHPGPSPPHTRTTARRAESQTIARPSAVTMQLLHSAAKV